MNLTSTTFWSAVYAAIRMLSGVISVKVLAYFAGPAGVAYVGQFQSFLTITHNGSNLGIGQGTIKYLAEYKEDQTACQKILSTAFSVTLLGSTLLGGIILLFHEALSVYLFKTALYQDVLIVLGLTIVVYSFGQLLMHTLNGFQEIKSLIRARILASIIGLMVTILLVVIAGVKGALLALIVSQLIAFGVLTVYTRKYSWFSKQYFLKGWDRKNLWRLGQFSLMTFASVILLHVRQIYLREHIMVELSIEAAGYWQAIWKISEMYLTIITFALSVYYLPKLSSIQDKLLLKQEIFNGYRFLIPLVLCLSLGIFLTRDWIVWILFTPDFYAVRELFLFQLIGDVFKIAAWILSFLMVAKAMTKLFIITEVIFITLFLVFSLYGVQWFGLIGMTYAFAWTYFIYFLTMLFLFRDILLYQAPANK